ncbi:unnamed protein product [Linum trigynum]|uniref:RING-type E3 ubiquitin transferase n=2 Tax=Linum trigynum TaxID=586398 RepID=A0AAV2DUW4_9ROSI
MASMGSPVESNSGTTGASKTVYVALGNDLQEGLKTLDWTLRKWSSSISKIVILHLAPDCSNDVVNTHFGKVLASSMSDEKLEALRNYEQRKVDKLLSEYIAYCGKGVRAKVMKLEKSEEPIERAMVELISKLKFSTLVMGISFLKSSPSWKKTRNTIGALFYIHQKKAKWCEMWIVCGGKLVRMTVGESDEGVAMEDEEGKALPSSRSNSTGGGRSSSSWLGRVFSENQRKKRSSSCIEGRGGSDRDCWESNGVEIEKYLEDLMIEMGGLNVEAEIEEQRMTSSTSSVQQQGEEGDDVGSQLADHNLSAAQKMEIVRSKIKEVGRRIELKREEAEANAERSANAEWAISLCNSRVEELEIKIKAESTIRSELTKKLESDRERIEDIKSDVEESQNRVRALAELQSELSSRLQMSTAARSAAEAQLQRKSMERAEVVRGIDELRRQRDVLQRRIEFCKEKDAIGGVMMKFGENLRFSYREYSGEDVRSATDDFSDGLRLKSGDDWSTVYRGRISQKTAAIKLFSAEHESSNHHDFLSQVKFLSNIRHPHLVAMMGFCSEPKCIIYEYMHEGSLRDNLLGCSLTSHPGSGNRTLKWFDRIRVAYQICSALAFLHSAKPNPIVHGKLTVSNVLLDRNMVAKLTGFRPSTSIDLRSDIRALGIILLHLLSGKNWGESVESRMRLDRSALVEMLDEMAGPWPLGLTEEIAGIAMRCLSTELDAANVLKELEELVKKGEDIVSRFGRQDREMSGESDEDDESSSDIPSFFLCPILRDVMENPYVAADGFSYEREAMEEWLQMGKDTSPMTNLRLDHTVLTPNQTLRSLIEEWRNKRNDEPSCSSSSHI